jgi:hypothetical protein
LSEEDFVLLPVLSEESGLQEGVAKSVACGAWRPGFAWEVLSRGANDRGGEGEV